MDIKSITFEEFYEDNAKLKEFAFLFGNGFPKSNSVKVDEKLFKDRFTLSEKEYEDIWDEVDLRVKWYTKKFHKLNKKKGLCPEELLNFFRCLYGILIFKTYQEKQKDLTNPSIYRPTKFLNNFKSIYTLNYDFYSYVSFLKDPTTFKDGFSNSPITIKCIKNRLETKDDKIPFYFLHGAFHLLIKDEKYQKICAENGTSFPDMVIQTYNEMDKKLEEFHDGKIDLDDPILVLSGRPTYKNAAISNDEYLQYSLECLKNERKIFTFGCSFKLDSHILDVIFENYINKEIYLGWYHKDDQETIQKYLRRNKITDCNNLTFVDISKNQEADVDSIIWNDN